MTEMDKEYFAFISYKREDEKWAKWLQDKLEHYRFPANLNGRTDLPKHIRPTFRDVTDLTSGLLAEEIDNALRNSLWLIVICSPRSAKSPWVCKEAQTFINLGLADHIVPFVIEGRPFSNDSSTECYPEALLKLTGRQEVLATNINEMGRDAAAIKIIARMFGLRFDTLWQRHEREIRKRRFIAYGVITGIIALSIVLLLFFRSQNRKLLQSQSQFIAEKAEQLIEQGDTYQAQLLLLDVLPDGSFDDRPYVVEAESAFRKALNNECSVLCKEISQVKAEFSPDGKYILTGNSDGGVNIWNAQNGKLINRFDGNSFFSASFSPDQKHLLVVSGHGGSTSFSPKSYNDILILDAISGKSIKTLKGHEMEVYEASYSQDGSHIVSTSWDGTIRIWNAITGKCIQTINGNKICDKDGVMQSHRSLIALLSPDKKTIVSNFGNKNELEFRDASSGKCIQTLRGFRNFIYTACYSHDGGHIAAAGNDSIIMLWNTNGENLNDSLIGHTKTVFSVSYSKDDKYLVSTSNDSTVRVWDVIEKKCIRTLKKDFVATYACFSPDGKSVLLSSARDNTVRVWNIPKDSLINAFDKNQNHDFERFAYSSNGNYLAFSGSGYGGVYILNMEKKQVKVLIDQYNGVSCMNFSHDGSLLMTYKSYYDDRSNIRLWNAKTGELLKTFPTKGANSFSSSYRRVVLSDDGSFIVSAEKDSILYIWDTKTGECVKNIKAGICDFIAIDPSSKYIATSLLMSSDIKLIDIGNISKEMIFKGQSGTNVYSLYFSPKENQLMSTYSDGRIVIWDITTGKIISEMFCQGGVNSASYSIDGKYVITVCKRNTIQIWDKYTESCLAIFTNVKNDLLYAFLSEDDQTIISASTDGAIRYWDFPPLQNLINQIGERFKDRQLTPEERKKYHIE